MFCTDTGTYWQYLESTGCSELELLHLYFKPKLEQLQFANLFQTMLLHATGNEAVTAFFDVHNLSDNERLTAMALAFSCQLLLHVDDFKSLQEHYSYLLDNLFKDVNLQRHIKGYMDEMERTGKLGNIKILNSYSKTTVRNLQKLLDCVYAVVKQVGSNQNPEIALKLMNDIIMPSSLKEKRHNFITMHSVSD